MYPGSWSMEARGRQEERSEATRARLISAARDLFAKRGYSDVGTEEIVRRARVTRGALYHHFRDKRELFRAVHEQLEAELADAIATRLGEAGGDPLELMRIGIHAFLDACTEPELARISLIEAPAVLGWQAWREIDERYGLGLISTALRTGMDAGELRRQPIRPLSHLLLAAMGEAGMVIANAADPRRARREIEPALLELLEGLRA